ncbi:MAG: hypothetical protein HYY45_01740 [Deltaproteobacteria bacterium]|nr:hypothetical protein [Deltaproteobacteria bacterium]
MDILKNPTRELGARFLLPREACLVPYLIADIGPVNKIFFLRLVYGSCEELT